MSTKTSKNTNELKQYIDAFLLKHYNIDMNIPNVLDITLEKYNAIYDESIKDYGVKIDEAQQKLNAISNMAPDEYINAQIELCKKTLNDIQEEQSIAKQHVNELTDKLKSINFENETIKSIFCENLGNDSFDELNKVSRDIYSKLNYLTNERLSPNILYKSDVEKLTREISNLCASLSIIVDQKAAKAKWINDLRLDYNKIIENE